MKARNKAMLIALMAMACFMVGCDDGDDEESVVATTVTFEELQNLAKNDTYIKATNESAAITIESTNTNEIALIKKLAACTSSTVYKDTADTEYVFSSAKWKAVKLSDDDRSYPDITLNGTEGQSVTVKIEKNADAYLPNDLTENTSYTVENGVVAAVDGNSDNDEETLYWVKRYYEAAVAIFKGIYTAGKGAIDSGKLNVTNQGVNKVVGSGFTQWQHKYNNKQFDSTSLSAPSIDTNEISFFMECGKDHAYVKLASSGNTVIINNSKYNDAVASGVLGDGVTSIASYLMTNFNEAIK